MISRPATRLTSYGCYFLIINFSTSMRMTGLRTIASLRSIMLVRKANQLPLLQKLTGNQEWTSLNRQIMGGKDKKGTFPINRAFSVGLRMIAMPWATSLVIILRMSSGPIRFNIILIPRLTRMRRSKVCFHLIVISIEDLLDEEDDEEEEEEDDEDGQDLAYDEAGGEDAAKSS